jgi:predicted transcriptional regulator
VSIGQVGDTAKRLLAIVRLLPGVHLREVQRRTGLGLGDTVYQLRKLEALGLIDSEMSGRYRRYYSSEIEAVDRTSLSVLRNSNRRQIIAALLSAQTLNLSDLAFRLGVGKSTIVWHLGVLESAGLVDASKSADGSTVWLLKDRERTKRLLARFKPSTLDELSQSFLQSWDLLGRA